VRYCWLPEKGGILYSSDMTIFYQTFFKNPNADWRYILGFEPALMPDEDFRCFNKIMWNYGDAKSLRTVGGKNAPAGSPRHPRRPGQPAEQLAIGMGVWRQRHLDWTPAAHPAKRDAAADHFPQRRRATLQPIR